MEYDLDKVGEMVLALLYLTISEQGEWRDTGTGYEITCSTTRGSG